MTATSGSAALKNTLAARRAGFGSGGIAFVVCAVACFGAMDTASKVIALSAPIAMALWVRYLIQVLATAAMVMPKQGLALWRTRRIGLHVVRGLLLVSISVIGFISLRHMHVGEYTAIVMLTPLLLTVVAAAAMKERVSWTRWLCVIGGFAGTLAVIRPGREVFQLVTLLPLVLVVTGAAFQALTRHMTETEDSGTLHVYSGLVGLAIMSVGLPYVWQALPWRAWGAIGLLGFFGTLGHFLLILAYQRAPVALLTPYLYLQIAFSTFGGWLVFSHVPDDWSMAGIATIAVCGVVGTWLTAREVRRSL